jgi:hypothetical protein
VKVSALVFADSLYTCPRPGRPLVFGINSYPTCDPYTMMWLHAMIQAAVTIPVMAKARIGHFVEAQILQAIGVDFIDESEVLTPADGKTHTKPTRSHPVLLCIYICIWAMMPRQLALDGCNLLSIIASLPLPPTSTPQPLSCQSR